MGTAEDGPFCFEKQLYGGLFDAYEKDNLTSLVFLSILKIIK